MTHEELQSERKVCAALKDAGVQAKFSWGSTLYHIDDLPFKLESMPSNYAGFREQVRRLTDSCVGTSGMVGAFLRWLQTFKQVFVWFFLGCLEVVPGRPLPLY